jgi:hypothetical protein
MDTTPPSIFSPVRNRGLRRNAVGRGAGILFNMLGHDLIELNQVMVRRSAPPKQPTQAAAYADPQARSARSQTADINPT